MTLDFKTARTQALAGVPLSVDLTQAAFREIMAGGLDPIDVTAFLIALKVRGETADELVGAARVLRETVDGIETPDSAMDTCGTGGDGIGTYNISTAVALVLAARGVPIAKHGNRSVSSKSGSSDVLEALGVALDLPHDALTQSLADYNIAFLFAPAHHPAMAGVASLRKQLKTRTIFNLIGPLANPGGVKQQLLGTYDQRWCRPMAEALKHMGSTRAWVVHGADGLDELSITGPSHIAELKSGAITEFNFHPEEAGLPIYALDDLRGGDAAENADAMRALLEGKKGAFRDAVLLNAASALLIAGKTEDMKSGVAIAAECIDSGEALKNLDAWAAFTQSHKSK